MDDYRRLFPAAVCYAQIVPVDELLTLTLFYREDDQFGSTDTRRRADGPAGQALLP